ncbi:MAG: hypothetical protein JSS27_17125 [Planctomycetes bacterium]|nr:hypothetical protein [Planctomycetota bacterium]
MPRFVVLRHELPASSGRPSHWDLMFEVGGVLRTWAIETLPDVVVPAPVTALPDHRLVYLEYEGPVSDDRGSVIRWDAGQYEVIADEANHFAARLICQKLLGKVELTRAAADATHWTWHYRPGAAPD